MWSAGRQEKLQRAAAGVDIRLGQEAGPCRFRSGHFFPLFCRGGGGKHVQQDFCDCRLDASRLLKISPICHSEGAKRPKNLKSTRSFAALRMTKRHFTGSSTALFLGEANSSRCRPCANPLPDTPGAGDFRRFLIPKHDRLQIAVTKFQQSQVVPLKRCQGFWVQIPILKESRFIE